MYKRITKRTARKLFAEGKSFTLCPCKFVPGGSFCMSVDMMDGSIAEWKEHAARYAPSDTLWKGDIDKTAWDLMYNNWAFYNSTHETGYYAHYYTR